MGNPLEHLEKALNLTAEQKAKAQPIFSQIGPKMQAIHEEAAKKGKAAMESTDNEIKSILNDDQKKKFEELQQHMKAAAAAPGHDGFGPQASHRPMGNPIEHLEKALGLTAEQKTKLQPIFEQAKPKVEAIHQEVMSKSKEVMEAMHKDIKSLLTPEQQEKFEKLHQEHAKPPTALAPAKA
jgi:Spy/CpxP family protein refolding chaperone